MTETLTAFWAAIEGPFIGFVIALAIIGAIFGFKWSRKKIKALVAKVEEFFDKVDSIWDYLSAKAEAEEAAEAAKTSSTTSTDSSAS